jgi:cytoskeleton protein RodZ
LFPPWLLVGGVLVAVAVALYVVGSLGSHSTTTTSAHIARRRPPVHRVHRRPRPAPPPKPTAVTLQLTPTGTVYVCLVDGTGKQLIPGKIFSVGERVPVETSPKLLLTLGNNSVQMKVNGKPVPVAPSGNAIGFVLVPGKTAPLPSAQQPRCL